MGPVAGPEGVGWEGNLGMGLRGNQAGVSNCLPVKKNDGFLTF